MQDNNINCAENYTLTTAICSLIFYSTLKGIDNVFRSVVIAPQRCSSQLLWAFTCLARIVAFIISSTTHCRYLLSTLLNMTHDKSYKNSGCKVHKTCSKLRACITALSTVHFNKVVKHAASSCRLHHFSLSAFYDSSSLMLHGWGMIRYWVEDGIETR